MPYSFPKMYKVELSGRAVGQLGNHQVGFFIEADIVRLGVLDKIGKAAGCDKPALRVELCEG